MTRLSIGNRKHAEEALSFAGFVSTPADWVKLGSGSYRIAYLHKATNVVYKVAFSEDYDGYGNDTEYRHARRLYKRYATPRNGVRVPLVSRYRIDGVAVLAMERVKGRHWPMTTEPPSTHTDAVLELFSLHFNDMHQQNFIVEDETGTLVPVDMASPRNPRRADVRLLPHPLREETEHARGSHDWVKEYPGYNAAKQFPKCPKCNPKA